MLEEVELCKLAFSGLVYPLWVPYGGSLFL